MDNEWNLRDSIYIAAHRWPYFFLAMLVGCLLGWGFSLVWPAGYRAEASLHVSYNTDTIFRNPDDYKNWQMDELNLYILSDPILEETLDQLQIKDPYWKEYMPEKIRPMLNVYWRNVGVWRLTVDSRESQRAIQLIDAWSSVIIKNVGLNVTHANTALGLFLQMQNNLQNLTAVRLRLTTLNQVQAALQTWQKSGTGDLNGSLSPDQRWRLLSLAAQVASDDAAGKAILDGMPPADANMQTYQQWVDQVLAYIGAGLPVLTEQSAKLKTAYEQDYPHWVAETTASQGMTAYLRVEPISYSNAAPRPIRSSPQAALVGGMIGLLIWVAAWIALPVIRMKK